MNVVGIIAEYNPLTEGHRYHFNQAMSMLKAEASIAVMSGNFVQRGEPAIFDKYQRAQACVNMGIDLVLELPFLYATSSAEGFAQGAIDLFNRTEIVKWLVFGSESGSLQELQADIERQEELFRNDLLKEKLKSGESYAKVLSSISEPNDILGLEYLKALKTTGSDITPIAIKRIGSYHSEDTDTLYPSATSVRKSIREGHIEAHNPIFLDDFSDMIFSRLITSDITDIYGMKEGIHHALQKAAINVHTIDELIQAVRTPRFSIARLKRLLIHTLMDLKAADVERMRGSNYLRVLAFNQVGQELLKHMRGKYISKVSEKLTNPIEQMLLDLEIRASNLYYHIQGTPSEYKKTIQPR